MGDQEEPLVTEAQLEEKIRSSIVEGGKVVTFLKATDVSGCGCGQKFEITIASDIFDGKPLLAQHRLVHKMIEEERKTIHALTLKTMSVETWNKQHLQGGEQS